MDRPNNIPWYKQLHWQILMALAAGSLVGVIGGKDVVPYVAWMGTLIIRMLKMVIIPLVFSSIVSGVASVGSGRDLGRLFSKTLGYYLLSSLLAASAGLTLSNLIKPGDGAQFTAETQPFRPDTPDSAVDLLLDIVPENIVAASAAPEMLQVIFFCILFGLSIAVLPDKHRLPLQSFIESFFQAMMKMTGLVIKILPIGVFGLIVRVVGETGFSTFKNLGLYMLTIASGLAFHFFITLPILLFLLARIKPAVHYRNMADVMLMAFSTSSSAATLPLTMNAVENKVGVSNRTSSFVLPMGATVNMDGTALYECAGVLFIAQALGADLSIGQQLIVVLTALLASIGAAAVPSAGLVVIFICLDAVNLRGPEVEAIVGAMLAIDRPLDMARTMVNVMSDSCGAAIIARSEGEEGVDVENVAAAEGD